MTRKPADEFADWLDQKLSPPAFPNDDLATQDPAAAFAAYLGAALSGTSQPIIESETP